MNPQEQWGPAKICTLLEDNKKSSITWFTQARPNIVQKPNMALKMAWDKQISCYIEQKRCIKKFQPGLYILYSIYQLLASVDSQPEKTVKTHIDPKPLCSFIGVKQLHVDLAPPSARHPSVVGARRDVSAVGRDLAATPRWSEGRHVEFKRELVA